MVLLSVTGLFKTLLIIVGVFVLLRFFGRVMVAKRNMEEHRKTKKAERESEEMIAEARRNHGRTTISKIGKSKLDKGEYTDYEEID